MMMFLHLLVIVLMIARLLRRRLDLKASVVKTWR